MVSLSVKQNPLLQKQFKVATPSMCRAEYVASLHVYTASLKKEECRITSKRKETTPSTLELERPGKACTHQ